MTRPVMDREVIKPHRIGVIRNISDLRDRVMFYSDGMQVYELCSKAAAEFACQLAECLYREIVDNIMAELMDACKHRGPCSVKFEVGYRLDERIWEYTEEEQDERITKGIEEAKKQALLREAETQEADERRLKEYARRALCTELSPAERQHLEDAARQFEAQFAGTPVIDAGFGIKLPKRTGDSPDGK